MSGQMEFSWGGDWTEQKLQVFEDYLAAYRKVMKKQNFRLTYIDAFAGTGYRDPKTSDEGLVFPELTEKESLEFLDGSASIALRIDPPFHRYIFIEKSERHFAELLKLKERYPHVEECIEFRHGDANDELQAICSRWDSEVMRGVLFLDPFGMQVDWQTLEAVAGTHAIDVWILFPLGIGVNRMLPRSGRIPESWRAKLDRVFGTRDWYERFYSRSNVDGLFERPTEIVKKGSFNAIADYYQERLRAIFAEVASNPRVLCNSHGTPLFMLCFAVSNPRHNAVKIALDIAQHILGRKEL